MSVWYNLCLISPSPLIVANIGGCTLCRFFWNSIHFDWIFRNYWSVCSICSSYLFVL